MQLTLLSSTNLHAAGYNPLIGRLYIQFKNGMVYQYDNVSPEVYASLTSGDSGRYFAEIIKPQRYTMPYVKLGLMALAGPTSVLGNSIDEDIEPV